jgi:flavin reductase
MTEEGDLKGGLRLAMRRLTSAVSVITTELDGCRYGMTATSVTSVSMTPPSLLVCINRLARLHDPLIRRGAFCVNILHAHDGEIAEAFGGARMDADRFACGAWDDSHGLPHLVSAQANVFCELDAISSYGTHSIMIGKVGDVVVRGNVSPLIYEDGKYTVGLGDGVDWVVPIA